MTLKTGSDLTLHQSAHTMVSQLVNLLSIESGSGLFFVSGRNIATSAAMTPEAANIKYGS